MNDKQTTPKESKKGGIDEAKFIFANRQKPQNKHGPWCHPEEGAEHHKNQAKPQRDKTLEHPVNQSLRNQSMSRKKRSVEGKTLGKPVTIEDVEENLAPEARPVNIKRVNAYPAEAREDVQPDPKRSSHVSNSQSRKQWGSKEPPKVEQVAKHALIN